MAEPPPTPEEFLPHPDGQRWGAQRWGPTPAEAATKGYPPVLLLPGFTEDHSIFRATGATLGAAGYPTLAVDLPGQSHTPLRDKQPDLDAVATWLVAGLRAWQPGPCVVVGHSMGGYLALALAEVAPSQVKGLGLWHSAAAPDDPDMLAQRERAQAFLHKHGSEVFAQGLIPQYFGAENKALSAPAVALAAAQPPQALIQHLQWMARRPDRQPVLKQFAGPVLLLQGTEEPRYPRPLLEAEAAMPLHSTLRWVPAAHMGMYEAPEACHAELITWLDSHFQG